MCLLTVSICLPICLLYLAEQNHSVSTIIPHPQKMSYFVIAILILFVYFRNLRIREDIAKYLLNLDVKSAYYDPKTRSMREDPLPDADPNEKFYGVSIMGVERFYLFFRSI